MGDHHWFDYCMLGFMALQALIMFPIFAYVLAIDAFKAWVEAKEVMLNIRERLHRRRIEIMAKQIELEKVLSARESATPLVAPIEPVEMPSESGVTP